MPNLIHSQKLIILAAKKIDKEFRYAQSQLETKNSLSNEDLKTIKTQRIEIIRVSDPIRLDTHKCYKNIL